MRRWSIGGWSPPSNPIRVDNGVQAPMAPPPTRGRTPLTQPPPDWTPEPDGADLLTPIECAAILGDEWTADLVTRAIDRRELPSEDARGLRYVRRRDLEAFRASPGPRRPASVGPYAGGRGGMGRPVRVAAAAPVGRPPWRSDSDLLSFDEAAHWLGVTLHDLRWLLTNGKLATAPDEPERIPLAELKAYARRRAERGLL